MEDNGCGIAYADMQRLGLPHHTSKARSLEDMRGASTFGFRGEALASLQQVGLLSVTSRDAETALLWTKIMSGGKTLALQPAPASSRLARGTLVQLQDIFGQLPVRRRCMVAAAELQRIKLHLAAVALARPSVAITLTDATHGAVVLKTTGAAVGDGGGGETDSKLVFGKIFGLAKARPMLRVEAAEGGYILSGYISAAPHYTPELQVGSWGVVTEAREFFG